MTNEINLLTKEDQILASSLEIAEHFEKEHKDVLETIRNLTAENSAVKNMFHETTYTNSRGREYPEYLMNRDGFTLLVMGFTGKEALNWKLKYIEAFNNMEKALKNSVHSYMIQDPIERAKAWIKEEEERRSLQEDIKALEPARIFTEAVTGSDDTILVSEMAKILNQNGIDTGEKRFYQWLRENGYVIRREGIDKNLPTQKSLDLGILEIREGTRQQPGKEPKIIKTTRVTGKGQKYFINKFIGGAI